MGKRIISQNRGRGSPTYRAPSHKYKANLEHIRVSGAKLIAAQVVEIVHDPARNAPIARVRVEGNGGVTEKEKYVIIPEGIGVGDVIYYGEEAPLRIGSTLPLKRIPEGFMICNIEAEPNDGGKFVRASGVHATLLSHSEDGKALVQLPSGKKVWLSGDCFATIGVVAGGGRVEKPFVKAGKKYHKLKAKAAKYPRVRGVAMNPVDHPFGGGAHQHTGKPKTVSRGAPPGRKVGSIAAKRTGKK
ncbi:MAG: 50S ribosomal protein L2 [Candidatus Methanospirareceae archaeon]